MKQRTSHYIYLIIFLFSFKGFFAQEYTLNILSKNKFELTLLNTISYTKNHKDSVSLGIEARKISKYLKNIGYFTNTIDSIKKHKKKHTAYYSLNKKTDKAILTLNPNTELFFKEIKTNSNTVTIPIKNLQQKLSEISNELSRKGKSFSKIQLKNIQIKDKILFATLSINQSKKRTINKVVINDYIDFPKSYLKNYYNIKPSTSFNQNKIEEISKATKKIKFIKEIKPPEVLFTKDSTFLYMYLKKHPNNSFDGVVNFASKENGNIFFNGNIDLRLNNILNTGESFEVFWNSIGKAKQEFRLLTEIPYIFNSKISPQLSFSIYKQDSTFINTKTDSRLNYNINSKIKLALTYNRESSKNIQKKKVGNIETFNNYFLGLEVKFNIPKNDFFFNNKFLLNINPTFGKRRTDQKSTNQFKIESTLIYIWDLNSRNSIYIKNKTGHLNSDSYIANELFRIGGANSIRGFDEQSIFTKSYSYFNIEYRYLTSEKSYLYSITDIGKTKTNDNTLLGLGIGYLFTTNNSQIKISTAIGGTSLKKTDLKDSKITINWSNFF